MRPRGSPFQGHFNSRDFRDLQRSKRLQRFASHLNLNASVVLDFLAVLLLDVHVFIAEAVQKQQKLSVSSCLQKLCRKQLPGLSSSVCRSRSNILQKLSIGL